VVCSERSSSYQACPSTVTLSRIIYYDTVYRGRRSLYHSGEGHYYASQASVILRYLRTSQLQEEMLLVSDTQTFCWRVIGDQALQDGLHGQLPKKKLEHSIINRYSTDSIHKLYDIARVGTEPPFHPYPCHCQIVKFPYRQLCSSAVLCPQ